MKFTFSIYNTRTSAMLCFVSSKIKRHKSFLKGNFNVISIVKESFRGCVCVWHVHVQFEYFLEKTKTSHNMQLQKALRMQIILVIVKTKVNFLKLILYL